MSRLGKKLAAAMPRTMEERIESLRLTTLEAADLAIPFLLFSDDLADDPEFVEGSQLAEPAPIVKRALQKAWQANTSGARALDIAFMRFGGLWHGAVHSSAGAAVYYYFASDDVGILAVMSLTATKFTRFSVTSISAPTPPRRVKRGEA